MDAHGVAVAYQSELSEVVHRQLPTGIPSLEHTVVGVAQKHKAEVQNKCCEEIDGIDRKLNELRKMRRILCMDQRKETAKAIAKLMKKKAKIKSKQKIKQMITERAGVRRFTAFAKGGSNRIARVKTIGGQNCENPQDIADAFAEFYTSLYEQQQEGNPPKKEQVPAHIGDLLNLPPIVCEEVKQQAMKLPNGKAADDSNLVIEMIKHTPELVHALIAEMLTSILVGETQFSSGVEVEQAVYIVQKW